MNTYFVYWAWRIPLGTIKAHSLSVAYELAKRQHGRGVVVSEEKFTFAPPTITYL